MSNPTEGASASIQSKQDLIDFLASGEKPIADWRIGTEHEKFVFQLEDLRAPPYQGERGIQALLEGMAREFGWTPVLENGDPIALTKGLASVSLEPAGQFELSGAPLDTVH